MSDDNEHDQAGDTAPGASASLTADQIVDIVSEVVNKAITARSKSTDSKVEKALSEFSKQFETRFSELNKEKTVASGEPKVEDAPAYKGMQKQLSDLQSKLESAENAKAAERLRGREKDLRARVADDLIKNGVDPTRVRHAVGLLIDADKKVRHVDDDTDEVVFTDSDDQEVDYKTGLKSWLKSDDAKIYMAARGTTGTGSQRSPGQNSSKNNSNNGESAENAMLRIAELYKNGDL